MRRTTASGSTVGKYNIWHQVRETLPATVAILYQGQARLLGYAPGASAPDTLQLLKPGEIIGWTSLLRGVPCETAIASVETLCLTLKASDFLSLLELEPTIANAFRNYCSLVEVFDLLGAELERRGKIPDNLKELATATVKQATILNLPVGKTPLQSGMSVSGNIKLRERTVMSIFTDMFSSSVESLKFVR